MDNRKRGRPDGKANGGFKKSRQEMEPGAVGSKSKPCTKFFSTSGCPFGENCHFLHHVPGGYNAVAHMINPGQFQASRQTMPSPSIPNRSAAPAPAVKSKLCNKYNTAEGCKFGDKCNFAHGEWEIGKPTAPPSHEQMPNRFAPQMHHPAPAPSTFGASATAKISVDASLAGGIIGKGGSNSKMICRQTGVKLVIKEHETDANLRNIELEGSFEQIQHASQMVRDLILSLGSTAAPGKPHGMPVTGGGGGGGGGPPRSAGNMKTKLCGNFAKGSCTFGDRCHFAHGDAELRKSGVV